MEAGPAHYLKRELYDLVRRDSGIFEFLQSGSLDGLWFWDIEHPEEEWLSPRFKEVFGYADDEIPNTAVWWQQNIFPEDLALVFENFRRHCADPKHPYDQIVRYRHKNGSTVWIRCRGTAIRDASGKPVRMLGAHTDVTAVIQGEQERERHTAAQEAAVRFRRIAESLPQLVWTCEPDGYCDYLSRQWVEYTGVPEADQFGARWLEQVHPDDRVRLVDAWQAAVGSGGVFQVEFRIRRHDGVYGWFDTRALPLRDVDGRIVKWIGSNSDIQQQRETRDALRESEMRLQAIIANLNDGLIVSDRERRVLHWNPSALAMHGFADHAEVERRLPEMPSILELATLEGTVLALEQWPLVRLFRGEPVRDWQLRLRRLDAEWERIFSYSGAIVPGAAGEPLGFLTIRDITARHRAEALLRGQKQVLEMVATGEPLPQTLEVLLRFIESQARDMVCSILLLDTDGKHLQHGAAPSLSTEYCRAIDGTPIGPCAGSCGTAAYRREPVFVADIASDPLWADYKHLALPYGLRACWSTPISDAQKKVLGTFAIYYREPGLPKPQHLELITFATHTAAICIGRQRTESALVQSEARYALVVRGSNDGIWDWDVATGREYLSPRWRQLLGFAADDTSGIDGTFLSRLHPDDVWRANAAVQAHLQHRVPYDIELRLRTKQGEYRWFLCRGQAEWNSDGKPVRMAGSIADITERKRAKAELRDAAEFNRQIIASADDGIVVLDRDLRYTVWNPFMEELMGRRADEVLGRHPDELFPWVRKGGQLEAMQRALTGEVVIVPDAMRIKSRSHRICWVQARLSALRNANGDIIGVIATIIDVTERKLAEEQLRGSHEQLRALAARLESIREEQSAHIAREIHDVLGQQLTALKLDLAWMKRRVAAVTDPAMRTTLTDKLTATSGLVDTTIHTVQRVATELRPGLLDKLGLAAALSHEAREFAERAGLRCHVDIEAGLPHIGSNQAIGVFRVSQEMMTNIARHAQATEFGVRLTRAADRLVLEVTDNGRGIEEQELHAARSLGLRGMKERAELLGGKLDIRGARGHGTIAVLSIPLLDSP